MINQIEIHGLTIPFIFKGKNLFDETVYILDIDENSITFDLILYDKNLKPCLINFRNNKLIQITINGTYQNSTSKNV